MKGICLLFAILLLVIFANAEAALIDNDDGTITDTDTGLMWLQNANIEGAMTWDNAVIWANSFVFANYDDWRLPTSADNCFGKHCDESEMGHLFYVEEVTSHSHGSDPFFNVMPYMYWSADEYASNPAKAWRFNFKHGSQGVSNKTLTRYVWAVRDAAVVPEPISSVLFLAGGALLAVRRNFKK